MTTAVAIALYNGEQFVQKQLECIFRQTKQPDQVVLCDDGSKDNTVQIVRDFIEQNGLTDKWTLVINETNLGYAANFVHAMEQCTADVIFLADQDDIWKLDKIEKMTQVMHDDPSIMVLSCKHGVIDSNDQPIRGLLVPAEEETMLLSRVTTEQIMRSFRWPGMCMSVRNSFFREILPCIDDTKIPHDVVVAVCAADRDGFWEFGYIGADHRRHTNNAGKEEHRIRRVLNLDRKIGELNTYNDMLSRLLSGRLPLGEKTRETIRFRLQLSQSRKAALERRSWGLLRKTYSGAGLPFLRVFSLMCDVWLICFGDYKSLRNK